METKDKDETSVFPQRPLYSIVILKAIFFRQFAIIQIKGQISLNMDESAQVL